MTRERSTFRIRSAFLTMMLSIALVACSPADPGTEAVQTALPSSTSIPTVTPLPTATPVPGDPAADLAAIQAQISEALVARDFETLVSLMSEEFAVGPWRSEWSLYTPRNAIDQFFVGYLVEDTSLDLAPATADEITAVLGGQPATEMLGPTVDIVGFLLGSGWGPVGRDEAILFIVEEQQRLVWKAFLYTSGPFAQAAADTVLAPAGTLYGLVGEGLFVQGVDGSSRLLTEREGALPSPAGRSAAYMSDDRQLFLVDFDSGDEEPLASGSNLSGFFRWGDEDTLLVGVWLDPNMAEGSNLGHVATLDVNSGDLQVLDEERLSGNRPAMATDGQWVAFDVFQAPPFSGQLYHPDSDLQRFEPGSFVSAGDLVESMLFNPDWSPDGSQIAWLAGTGERNYLLVFDLEGQTVTTLFEWDPARFGALIPSPVWSPGGDWLALEVWANDAEETGLWLFAADSSVARLVDSQGSDPVWISPTQLAYNLRERGGVRLYDLSTDESFPLDLPAGSYVVGFVNPEEMGSGTDAIQVAETPVSYIQAQQDVTMYSGPGEGYDVIGFVADGQTALVTGTSFDSLWWRVICPDDSVGNCWVTADPAFTVPTNSPTGQALPSPDTLEMTESSTPSPDGRWQATAAQSEPVLVGESEQFYTTLTVSDGTTTWTPVSEWRGYGLGYLWPAVVQWSRDGRYLYYTNRSAPDGCGLFVNGSDLYRLDIMDGTVTELLPAASTAHLALSPDEEFVAYTSFQNNQVTLHVRDLASGSEQRVRLTERNDFAQSGAIVWSPDGTQLLLTLAHEACNPDWSHSVVRVDLDDQTVTILIDRDASLPTTVAWLDADTARLSDKDAATWLLDTDSGEVSPNS